MHYDVIVIGMGLSGLMAAKTAVESGRKVLIVGRGAGSLCLFSNSIDVLSEGVTEIQPQHPYSKVGQIRIGEAISSFLSLFPAPYTFESINGGNCLILTGAGTFRSTRLIPITMVAGTSIKDGHALIVGFEGFKDFYADYAAEGLKCRAVTLPIPEAFNQEITAAALSRLMEQEGFRAYVAKEVRRHLRLETRVGFPAVLGLQDPVGTQRELEKALGVEVFEIPTLPPSIPGQRIFNRFRTWLIQHGVTFLMGHPVSSVSVEGKRCDGIYVVRAPVSTFYSGDRFIVATGRFVGGGLIAGREKISEALLGMHVFQPRSREDWFGKSFGDSHAIHQAGVLTDSSLQPVDEDGNRTMENVWVAGSILAHHNMIQDKSREGIEIATGHTAARHALER